MRLAAGQSPLEESETATVMKTFWIALVILTASAFGQTTNIFGTNEMTINGTGFGATSAVPALFAIGSGLNINWNAIPNAIVIVAVDAVSVPGTVTVGPGNSLDLPVSPAFQIVLDGTGSFAPSWLSPFLRTDNGGFMAFNVPGAPLVGGPNFSMQSALVSPTFPAGIYLSASFDIAGPTPPVPPVLGPGNATCSPLAVNTGIVCDDCFVTMNLNFNYTFYGQIYTQVHVGSNGYATFNTGDSTYFETVSWFLAGPPRIAVCFDDMAPFNGGTINFYTDGIGTFEICWVGVQEYFNNGPNTYKITALPGFIAFDYNPGMSVTDCIVGLSPGNGIDPVGLPTNIGAGSNVFTGTVAPYQIWDGALSTFNLSGFQVIWALNASGVPITQN